MSLASSTKRHFSKAVIQVDDLTFTYAESNVPALCNISLEITPGEFILLAGPSGCGKSTLARCLVGFIPHEFPGDLQGNVVINGVNTQTRPVHDLAQIINLVQQDPDSQLVTLNVTDEIAFGPENFQIPPEDISKRLEWALSTVNAISLKDRRTLTLSGGEKQKTILASFLAIQTPMIILDEPLARLDPPTARDVIRTLRELHRESGLTVLVIEHRIAPFLSVVDRCLLMEAGRLVFDGSPTSLTSNLTESDRIGVHLSPPEHGSQAMLAAEQVLDVPLLDIQDVSFAYPSHERISSIQPVLQDISFSLNRGEIVALMGANGSGKTTLLLQIMGLLHPDKGEIKLNGKAIHNRPVSELAQDIGFIFQNPLHQLFERTIWDELLLASRHLEKLPSGEAQRRAEELLMQFNLTPYRHNSPFTLSVGEQRRLTIASILVHQPNLLLLDEPFIGQDYRYVHRLMSLIQQSTGTGATAILATHDPNVAQAYCHRLIFLRDSHLLVDASIPQAFTQLEQLDESLFLPQPALEVQRRK